MFRLLSVLLCLLLTGCSGNKIMEEYPIIEEGLLNNQTKNDIKIPEASGVLTMQNEIVIVDYSNNKNGYIMAKTLSNNHSRIKIRITSNDEQYTYDLAVDNQYVTYPLTSGDGKYNVKVFENVSDNNYALLFNFDFNVVLENENDPYLYPNIIVDYNLKTKSVDKSFELSKEAKTNLEKVYVIYNWITQNIDYDYNKVEEVQGRYVLPILDETLDLKKGICFDYAALMSCMLRVQNIPCKVITGYVTEGYHAWVEVFVDDVGWINPDIYFKSKNWTLIDPTFDAMGGEKYNGPYESINKY